jgi:tRNA(fMet)-specific endonuclease VapC
LICAVLVLDTDHLTTFGYPSSLGQRLTERLDQSGQEVATTAISVDEQLTGLLAAIHQRSDPKTQIEPYAELVARMEFLASFLILPWDADAVMRFIKLKSERIRGGTMDLKIASITLAHDATLLTRNTVHFAHVPGLKTEIWLD